MLRHADYRHTFGGSAVHILEWKEQGMDGFQTYSTPHAT